MEDATPFLNLKASTPDQYVRELQARGARNVMREIYRYDPVQACYRIRPEYQVLDALREFDRIAFDSQKDV